MTTNGRTIVSWWNEKCLYAAGGTVAATETSEVAGNGTDGRDAFPDARRR